MKQIILTGDRPTGNLHVGHYVGSLAERVKLQNSGKYDEIYIMIADAQALTDNAEHPERVRQNIMKVALDYLAVGIDPEKAKAALETVANLDAGKLIDAGKVDDLKMEIKKSYDGKISDLEKALADSKKDSADRLAAKEASIRTLLVKGIFDSSAFLKDKTVLPSDVAYASFGRHFEVKEENGELRVVATMNGQPIFSRSDPGTFAAPEEALEAIIDKYPMKDRILKAPDGGSGSHPNSAYAPGAKIIPKGDMSAFGANLEAIAKGEVTVAAQ